MAIASVRDDQKPVGLYVHGWISMDLSGKISRESLGIMKCLKASGNSEQLLYALITFDYPNGCCLEALPMQKQTIFVGGPGVIIVGCPGASPCTWGR